MWKFLNTPLISGIIIFLLGGIGYLIRYSTKFILEKISLNKKWIYFKKTYSLLEYKMKKDFNEPAYNHIDELVVTKTKVIFNSESSRFYYDSSKTSKAWEGINYLNQMGYLVLVKTDKFFEIYRIKESLRRKLKD